MRDGSPADPPDTVLIVLPDGKSCKISPTRRGSDDTIDGAPAALSDGRVARERLFTQSAAARRPTRDEPARPALQEPARASAAGSSTAEVPRNRVALVFFDQFVIGKPLLVQFGLLVSDLRALTLTLRLLLGRLGSALGLIGPLLAHGSVLAIFANDTFPPSAKLILTSADARALTETREHGQQCQQRKHDDDYHHD